MAHADFADLDRDWTVGDWIVTGSGEAGHVADILESATTGRVHIRIMFARNLGNNEPDLLRIEPGRAGISGIQNWRKATPAEVSDAVARRRRLLNERLDEMVEKVIR